MSRLHNLRIAMLARPVSITPPPTSATWQPLGLTTSLSLSSDKLTATRTALNSSQYGSVLGTISNAGADKYFEVVIGGPTGSPFIMVGCANSFLPTNKAPGDSSEPQSCGYYMQNGTAWRNGSSHSYGAAYTAGDVIGIALKGSTGEIYFSLNGVWQNSGNPATGTNPAFTSVDTDMYPALALYLQSQTGKGNFDTVDLIHSLPSGFTAWGT
jgi:hypothetical protein